MAAGTIQLPPDSTGKKLRTNDRGTPGHDQYVIPTDDRLITYKGRATTFRTIGRAGTTGCKLFTLFNATGSTILVDIEKVMLDTVATAVIAVTVVPPVIRLYRIIALPTGGSALTKVGEDNTRYSGGSSSSVTVLGDASADGTLSATQLTATTPGGGAITSEFAPRLITAAGYEMFDRTTFLDGEGETITLGALNGVALTLDYTLATQNPSTNMWLASIRWTEYTIP